MSEVPVLLGGKELHLQLATATDTGEGYCPGWGHGARLYSSKEARGLRDFLIVAGLYLSVPVLSVPWTYPDISSFCLYAGQVLNYVKTVTSLNFFLGELFSSQVWWTLGHVPYF